MQTGFIKLFGIAAATALSLATVSRVQAVPIAPGQTLAAVGELDPTGGQVQAGTGVAQAFSSPSGVGSFSGTLTTTVIKNDPSNPLGGLTFTYKITNDAASSSALERMTNLNFTGWQT